MTSVTSSGTYLGIDLGTSGIKAILVDPNQNVLAAHTEKLDISRPHPGWSEQNPQDWYEATLRALDALHDSHPEALASVRGIGLSGQQHGAVLLDAEGEVLRPCLLWNDTRAESECSLFEHRFPLYRQITGNIAMPGFTAPKVMWVARHEPEIFGKVTHVVLPKAWLRFRMTGTLIEDMSDASGTLWLDTGRRLWSDAALEASNLRLAAMPDLCEGTAPAGQLNAELATRWGMTEAPIFAGGAGDNAAGAVGLGAIQTGNAFLSLGTSGVVWVTTDKFHPGGNHAIHSFCHAVPDKWHQMGVTLSAAASLAWWSRVTGMDEKSLLSELPETPEAPSPVLFAPYLSGERTPYNDGSIRGGFVGLTQDTTRAQMTQAVLEGVAFSFRDAMEGLAESGTIMTEADVIGGGSRSALWTSIMASVLGIKLHRLAHGEQGGAFGAARLARIAVTGEDISTVCLPPARAATIEPDDKLTGPYRAAYARYRTLFPALKSVPVTL